MQKCTNKTFCAIFKNTSLVNEQQQMSIIFVCFDLFGLLESVEHKKDDEDH